MNLLICSATDGEITLSKQSVNENIKIDYLTTGVGLTSATYSICSHIYKHRPDLVIQAGIAGCFDNSIPINEVVAIHKDCIGDQGVEESGIFKSLFDLKLISPNDPPWQNEFLVNQHDIINKCGLRIVNGVTVNEISTKINRIEYYRDQLKVQSESMEGAALHYVCIQEKIPFLQIRAISNYAGERDKQKWDFKNSIGRLNEELVRIIKNIKT